MAVKKNEFADDYRRRLEEARRLSETGDELDVLEKLKELVCMCGGEVPCKDGLDPVDLPNGPSVFTRVWYDSGNESLKADYHSDWDGDERIRTIDLDDCVWAAGYVLPFMADSRFPDLKVKELEKDYPMRYVKLVKEDFFYGSGGETPFARVHNKLVSLGGPMDFRYGWTDVGRSRSEPFISFGSGAALAVRGIGREGLYVVSDRDGRIGFHDEATFGILYEKGLGRTCRPSPLQRLEAKVNESKKRPKGLSIS